MDRPEQRAARIPGFGGPPSFRLDWVKLSWALGTLGCGPGWLGTAYLKVQDLGCAGGR